MERETVAEVNIPKVEVMPSDVDKYDYNKDDVNLMGQLKMYVTKNKEVTSRLIKQYTGRLDYLQELQEQELVTRLDSEKKIIFLRHINKIANIEREAITKLKDIAKTTEVDVDSSIDEFYALFDEQREKAKQWKDNTERYDEVLNRIKTSESRQVKQIVNNANELLEKHQIMFKKTIKLFQENEDNIKDTLEKISIA